MIARLLDRDAAINGVRDQNDPVDRDLLVIHQRDERIEVVCRDLDVMVARDQNISQRSAITSSSSSGRDLSRSEAAAATTAEQTSLGVRPASQYATDPAHRRFPETLREVDVKSINRSAHATARRTLQPSGRC